LLNALGQAGKCHDPTWKLTAIRAKRFSRRVTAANTKRPGGWASAQFLALTMPFHGREVIMFIRKEGGWN